MIFEAPDIARGLLGVKLPPKGRGNDVVGGLIGGEGAKNGKVGAIYIYKRNYARSSWYMWGSSKEVCARVSGPALMDSWTCGYVYERRGKSKGWKN